MNNSGIFQQDHMRSCGRRKKSAHKSRHKWGYNCCGL